VKLLTVQRWAWFTIIYILFVILWGAYVRATGSGAGCGDHWPLCNGVVIPRDAAIETLIELTHRVTSGLSLIFVIVLFILARKSVTHGHPLRRAAAFALFFIIVEALIGAGLVLFELVAHNASLKRMFSMSAHLLNTFALLSALSLCIWRSSESKPHRHAPFRLMVKESSILIIALGLIFAGMTGAIAALGDTLYAGFGPLPLKAYLDGEVPLILRLRLVHPVVSVVTAVLILVVQSKLWKFYRDPLTSRLGWSLSGLLLVQLALGFVNVQLMAPVWMQLVHLAVGVFLWVISTFFSFCVIDNKPKFF
jgi:heme A synthase